MEKKLEELYPGRWELSRYASGEHTVVDVRIYADWVAACRDVAAAGIGDMPENWDRLVESARVASKEWAQAVDPEKIQKFLLKMIILYFY